MKPKSVQVLFLITTGLLTLMMLMTIGNNIFNAEFAARFQSLGYPAYLIAPLMAIKALGLIAIWSNKSVVLREWAYAGFLFLFTLAMLAELNAPDADIISPLLAMILLSVSYITRKLKSVELQKAK